MYAVFRSGGKQYRAVKGDVLRLEKIEADEGATIKFDEVLLVGEGSDIKVGTPLLSGSTVSGKVVRQGKSQQGSGGQVQTSPELPASGHASPVLYRGRDHGYYGVVRPSKRRRSCRG